MKKSLLALALFGAMAGSTLAADVTLYGVVDTGVMYQYRDTVNYLGKTLIDGESSLGMASGIQSASRFGFKGSEDLGNGMTVSFKLENGFESDNGTLKYDRLFGREAQVSLSGAFGTVSFGRMGGLTSSAGTYDVVYGIADSFDGGDNNIATGFAMSSRYDNMVTYATPEFAGVTGYVQYSFQTAGQEKAHTGDNERYAAIGAAYRNGALSLVGAFDAKMRQPTQHLVGIDGGRPTVAYGSDQIADNQYTYNVGGSYDFGGWKLFGLAQYVQGADSFAGTDYATAMPAIANSTRPIPVSYRDEGEGLKGFALHAGSAIDIAGGNLTLAVYYPDGKSEDRTILDGKMQASGTFKADVSYYGLAARYAYPLSKRTSLYMGAGYSESKTQYSVSTEALVTKTGKSLTDATDKIGQAYVGITHTF